MLSTLERGTVPAQEGRHIAAPPPTFRHAVTLWYLLPIAAQFATGLWGAARRQLWLDEYATWSASTLDRASFIRLTNHLDTVQAPYYILIHYWIRAFGDSPLSLRIPSILAMAAGTWLVALIGTRVYGRTTGVLAGVLMAAVPFMALYAQTARPYAFAVMFAAGSTLALLRGLDRDRAIGTWLLYAVAIVGLGAVHLVALMLLLAHAAAVASKYRAQSGGRRVIARWLTAAVLALAALSPILYRGTVQRGQIGGGAHTVNQALFLIVYAFRSDLTAAIVVWFAVIGICLVRAHRGSVLCLAVWGVFPYALVIPTMSVFNLASLRYLLFALPPWFILAAAALCKIATTMPIGRLRIIPVLAVLIGLGLMVPGNLVLRRDPVLGYPDFRAAANTLASAHNGDGLITAGDNDFIVHPQMVAYYLRRHGVELRGAFLAQSPREAGNYDGAHCTDMKGCLARFDRVWLVTTASGDDLFGEMRPGQEALLVAGFQVAEVRQYTHVRVALLTRK
jgi:mannosyltransferase